MRLIDADALVEQMEKHYGIINLLWFIRCVKNCPTVGSGESDPVEDYAVRDPRQTTDN